jgi:hypothetical protein
MLAKFEKVRKPQKGRVLGRCTYRCGDNVNTLTVMCFSTDLFVAQPFLRL